MEVRLHLRGKRVIRLDTPVIAAAIVSVVGVFVLGVMDRPQGDGTGTLHPETVGRLDAPAPAVAVIDGDTLEIKGGIVRLAYIDAPELGQSCEAGGHLTACGSDAAFVLRKLIGIADAKPDCAPVAGTDAFVCRVGSADPAEVLLASGLATAMADAPAYYRAVERRARDVPLGIWKGPFVAPEEWRTGKRLPGEIDAVRAASAPTDWPRRVAGLAFLPEPISHRDPCVIKGVVSSAADRWYFGPLDPGYATIDVKAGKGRTFCSIDEARSAGWHHGHLALGGRTPFHN